MRSEIHQDSPRNGEKYFSVFLAFRWISSSVEPNESQIASGAAKRTAVGNG